MIPSRKKFKRFRKGHKDHPHARAFRDAKEKGLKGEELDAIMMKFAESQHPDLLEEITDSMKKERMDKEDETHATLNYEQLCIVKHWDIWDPENDSKLETLLKLSYYKAIKLPKKEAKTALEMTKEIDVMGDDGQMKKVQVKMPGAAAFKYIQKVESESKIKVKSEAKVYSMRQGVTAEKRKEMWSLFSASAVKDMAGIVEEPLR
jgi:hypothetical protein